MSKKDTFKNIVRYEIKKSLMEVYRLQSPYLTANQDALVDSVSEKIFQLFGDCVTVKELEEKVGKNHEITDTLQKN